MRKSKEVHITKTSWDPLWKNRNSIPMSAYEQTLLATFAEHGRFKSKDFSTILDYEGNKFLRFRFALTKSVENPVYNYVFFGPVVFKENGLHLKVQEKNKEIEYISPLEFIKKIKKDIAESVFDYAFNREN